MSAFISYRFIHVGLLSCNT